jgi:hypothetical protein
MNGFGLFAYINGNTYTGQFVGDCKHGHGRFLWANGDAYDGDFFVYLKLLCRRESSWVTLVSGMGDCFFKIFWSFYTGEEVRGGLKHGHGRFLWLMAVL